MSDMMDDIISNFKVDMNKIFVTGDSNGAILATAMVCLLSDYIAGAAPFVSYFPMKNMTGVLE